MIRRNLYITANTLIGVGVFGFLFASPEPARIVALPDGSATAVLRMPWAAALSLLAFVVGLGLLAVTLFMKNFRTPLVMGIVLALFFGAAGHAGYGVVVYYNWLVLGIV